MKIVFLNDSIYTYGSGTCSAVGGAERQQWLLARALAETGWSVTVGVRDGLEAGTRKALQDVEFVGIGGDHGHILLAWYRFLLSERPDWWYWRCASHLWGPAVEIAKLAAVRTIFSVAFDRDVQPRQAVPWRPRCWPLYAWGLSRTDRIFVQHNGQLYRLASQWRSKAHIVPSIAAETPAFKPHPHREKYVAWVGMLRQPKRPDLLIEIARRMPTLRFVVCGGPSTHRSPVRYSERVVEALRAVPNIDYLGQVPSEKTLQLIANASLLLSTSEEEGFPSTFLEAWSSGTPVVSLKIDPDHVIERVGLGTVSASMEAAIADIKALMNSPERREEIAVRARRHVAKAHSEAAVIKAFERGLRGVGA